MKSVEFYQAKFNKLKEAWESFVKYGKIDKDVVRPMIAESWLRCKNAGLNPYKDNSKIYLDDHLISQLVEKNKFLIKIALPIIEMAGNLIEGSGFRIDLVDANGYILKSIITENNVLENSKKVGSIAGTNRCELVAGTNGIGLSLYLREPVQIFGPEHYNIHYHQWTCASAPIWDNGSIIGIINISGHYTLMHKHTKGMAGGISTAIENAIMNEKKIIELTDLNKFLSMLIDSIYDGLIVVDIQNKITHLNSIGAQILGGELEHLIGKKLDKIKPDPSLVEMFNTNRQYFDKTVSLLIPNTNEKRQFLVNSKFIRNTNLDITNIMVVFGEMERIQRLAGGIIGARARFTFKDIIHKSESIEKIIQIARKIAGSDSKILINGESGTGKELFAQSIHNESSRKKQPFLAINCAALPRDLVESELFGYEEGAFTGAKKGGRIGKFELASGGTLFLDEIESMPLDVQAKLLRAIESNEIIRIGGNKLIPINVRIIASTNKDLSSAIQEGKFREDLYYRINTTIIEIPPLRERKEDIPVLVEYFITKLGYRFDKNDQDSKKILEALLNYHWPGNVRELENAIENLVILSPNNKICFNLLPEKIKNSLKYINKTKATSILDYNYPNLNLADNEKNIILIALQSNKGNITKTALALGVDRTTLIRKKKKYHID